MYRHQFIVSLLDARPSLTPLPIGNSIRKDRQRAAHQSNYPAQAETRYGFTTIYFLINIPLLKSRFQNAFVTP